MSNKKRRLGPTERWVQLKYWLLKSPAWRSLTGNAAKLYVELAMRYNGSNNGRIPYSVREAAKALNVSFQTAMRSLQLLQERGFIVCTRRGAFSLKAAPHASEWRLTEYSNDTPPEHATKDFMRWQPTEANIHAALKSRTRLSKRKRTLPLEEPHGCRGGNARAKKASDGCRGGNVSDQKSPSTFPPEQHLQLPGAGALPEGGERSAPVGSAVASEPPEWRAEGYPLGSPTRDQVLAALERQAEERWRARSTTSGHRAGPLGSAAPSSQ
jgi:DNA-binding transcriptional regulator YhcF (GntR family)